MKKKNTFSTNKLVMAALLSALAYILMFVGRVPMIAFLKYDPKDVIIMFGGIIFGPAMTILISLVVSIIEFMTVSGDGIIGLFMNVLSTISFVTVATIIYKRTNTLKGLISGLIVGGLLTTLVMVAWNYIVTPWFLDIAREAVVPMLLPIITPFNLIKSVINSTIIILLYQPVSRAMRTNKIETENQTHTGYIILISIITLISSVILVNIINNL